MHQAETRHIELRNATLGYCRYGTASGRPLIFLHGTAMRSTEGLYGDLLDRLGERFSVYALDLRGHGASSDALEGWSLDGLADDVAEFTAALGLDRPVVAGHSLGAFISLLAAIRHPAAFSTLCLLAPGPSNPSREPVEALNFMIEHGRDRGQLRAIMQHMFAGSNEALLGPLVDAAALVDPRLYRSLAEQNAQASIDDRLSEISLPTLLVCGSRDNVVPLATQIELARHLAFSKLVSISTEGHMIPFERPGFIAHEITTFVDDDSAMMRERRDEI